MICFVSIIGAKIVNVSSGSFNSSWDPCPKLILGVVNVERGKLCSLVL